MERKKENRSNKRKIIKNIELVLLLEFISEQWVNPR